MYLFKVLDVREERNSKKRGVVNLIHEISKEDFSQKDFKCQIMGEVGIVDRIMCWKRVSFLGYFCFI